MPHLHIVADSINPGTSVIIGGSAVVEGHDDTLMWSVSVAWDALEATINTAIKDAAIAAAAAAGFTVGALDKKTLYGGAVGL